MAIFSSRSPGYKAGMGALIVFFLIYLIGYASPFWAEASVPYVEVNQGLWMGCISSTSINRCGALTTSRLAGWFHVVRLMESVGMCLMLGSCVYAVVVNCCSSVPRNSRALEILGLVGGISAFIGAMVYAGKFTEADTITDIGKLSWAFYLAAVGSGAVILASIVVLVTNKPLDVPVTTGGVVMGGYPSGVVVQTGAVQQTAPGSYPGPSVAGGPAYGYGGGPAPGVYYGGAPPQAGYPPKQS